MSRFLTGLFAALALLISGVPAAAQSIGYSPNTLPLSGSCGVVTVSTPCLNLTQTWNNVATTFTGMNFNVTDTASASGSRLLDLQVGGVSKASVAKSGEVISAADFWVKSNGASAGIYLGTSADVFLTRDAANTLAMRNGTAAQKFSVYNTYTDASNYERGVFDWAGTANTLRIGTEAAGTGTVRNIQLVAGSNSVTATVGASNLLTLNGGLTTGGAFISGGNIQLPAAGLLYFNTRTSINSPVDAVVRLANNAGTITTDITLTGASGSGGSTANFGGNVGSGGSFIAAATGYYGFSTRNLILSPVDGTTRLSNWAGTITTDITLSGASGSGASTVTFGGGIKTTGATFALQTATTLTDNAAAQVATMTNGPAAGNPTKWIAINDNGTTRYIPAW